MGRSRSVRNCWLFAILVMLAGAAEAGVLITQVYGGGGNTGSTYQNDFVELFNPGTSDVSLNGWSLQYASSAGTTWNVTPLMGTIGAGRYFLVQQAAGGVGDGSVLPLPDGSGSVNMSNASGKVALVASTTGLMGGCPPSVQGVVDFVGYGDADCFEGSGAVGTLDNMKSATRAQSCLDTDDNAKDFAIGTPQPRNSMLAPSPCPQQIGYAVLQFPLAAMIEACPKGASTVAYGRVYVQGATDAQSLPVGAMVAQLGVFVPGGDPASVPASAWSDAIPNPGWNFGDNNDEYEAYLDAHASGMYDFAYRFSYANGPFIHADGGDGTTDGYSTVNAGKLAVAGDVIYCDRFDRLVP